MKTETIHRGTHTVTEFRPVAKNSMTKPLIKKQFYKGRGKERIRMYLTECGRTFLADVFDKIFNQGIKLSMKPKNFKPNSIDPRVIY